MSQARTASALLCLIGAVAGVFVAYLAAIGEAQGPIYSGWMMLFLVVAALLCGVAVIGGLLIVVGARLGLVVGVALLLLAACAYAAVLFLMLSRYVPNPTSTALISAGPVAILFLAAAVLGSLAHLRRAADG